MSHLIESANSFLGSAPKAKEELSEAVKDTSNIAKLRKIVKDEQNSKINGVIVDLGSASMVMDIYDKVSDRVKESMGKHADKDIAGFVKKIIFYI